MSVGVVNLFPLQQLHSLSSNCHCFCAGFFFSIKNLCLRVFYISSAIFAPSSGRPSPSFLLGGVDIQLHFSTVSNVTSQWLSFISYNTIKISLSLPSSTLIAPCHVTHCHKRNSISIAKYHSIDLPGKTLLLWYMGVFWGDWRVSLYIHNLNVCNIKVIGNTPPDCIYTVQEKHRKDFVLSSIQWTFFYTAKQDTGP